MNYKELDIEINDLFEERTTNYGLGNKKQKQDLKITDPIVEYGYNLLQEHKIEVTKPKDNTNCKFTEYYYCMPESFRYNHQYDDYILDYPNNHVYSVYFFITNTFKGGEKRLYHTEIDLHKIDDEDYMSYKSSTIVPTNSNTYTIKCLIMKGDICHSTKSLKWNVKTHIQDHVYHYIALSFMTPHPKKQFNIA